MVGAPLCGDGPHCGDGGCGVDIFGSGICDSGSCGGCGNGGSGGSEIICDFSCVSARYISVLFLVIKYGCVAII